MTDENKMDEQSEKRADLARRILLQSRNTLLINLRFLDKAISMLEPYPLGQELPCTDGKVLLYDPALLLRQYKAEKEEITREYLHLIMHGIFSHMFISPAIDKVRWNLACDIAVENAISELELHAVEVTKARLQRPFLERLRKDVPLLTAEKIYAYLSDAGMTENKTRELQLLFSHDSHEIWYMTEREKEERYGISRHTAKEQDTSESSGNESGDENGAVASRKALSESSENESEDGVGTSRQMLAEEWKKVSERMLVDMETVSKQKGDRAGGMVQNLRAVTREKYDYTSFLKKFAVLGEVMKINDDEFDYIFYTYGLKLYERMPLIEPLEYKDVKRIREFVIAIDTSGSTSGSLVCTFLQKTYNILKSTESFFTKINLYIIQCDAEIQEAVHITSQEEFDRYLENMQIHGLGGTDFRPVFQYVDGLIAEKKFSNLKGLIYFTDGYGDFPMKKPAYQTAFVFIDDEYNNPDVPSWAIRLVLQKDEI